MAKRILLALLVLVAIAVGWLALFPVGQRADRSYDPKVPRPAWTAQHPRVLFDDAHYNAHSVRGNYRPFARLLENDGYTVARNTKPFSAAMLSGVAVLVIVNAAGGSNPKLFGFNLPPLRKGRRDAPAFAPDEIRAVREWVANGGSLLLIADHYPFGPSASGLAETFGVTMHGGYAEAPPPYRPPEDSGAIEFSRANGLLPDMPITNGRDRSERVERVLSFTGQSLDVPRGAPLLELPSDAVEYVPPPPNFHEQPSGRLQAAALQYGKGRVVVAGEAAMFTAQIESGQRFGMNLPNTDNRQFALNILHWLSRLL